MLFGLLLMISVVWSGCDESLSTTSPSQSPGSFVECYMRPGELYNLTATQIQPIFEDYILDYSYDFKVYITDVSTHQLTKSLFVEPGTGYIYNYGSPARLDAAFELVSLLVITPSRDTLRAQTTIPEQVSFESFTYLDNKISAAFYTSDQTNQNYYIVIVNYDTTDEEQNIVLKFDIKYLELGDSAQPELHEVTFENDLYANSQNLKLTLMRVTEENYNYQISLEDAKSSGSDNITFPSPLAGNIQNGIGIFTAYTEDVVTF